MWRLFASNQILTLLNVIQVFRWNKNWFAWDLGLGCKYIKYLITGLSKVVSNKLEKTLSMIDWSSRKIMGQKKPRGMGKSSHTLP